MWCEKVFVLINVLIMASASGNKTNVSIYWHAFTLAKVFTHNDTITSCDIQSVDTPEDCIHVLKKMHRHNPSLPVEKVCFKNMMEILSECEKLEESPDPGSSFHEGFHLPSVSGHLSIFAGTKWCGKGNLAHGYRDLGINWKVDKCCRSHDLCPHRLLTGDHLYGLHNSLSYSVSHCDCNMAFRRCLREVGLRSARAVEGLFFDILRPPCIAESSKDTCQETRLVPKCEDPVELPGMKWFQEEGLREGVNSRRL